MFDLKAFRKKNGLTQLDVANALECKQSYISNVETGLNRPTESMVAKLIAIYGIDKVQEFMNDDSNEDEKEQNSRNAVNGDANNFGGTYNALSAEALDVIKEQSKQIGKSQEQIDTLLKMLSDKDDIIKSLTEALAKK